MLARYLLIDNLHQSCDDIGTLPSSLPIKSIFQSSKMKIILTGSTGFIGSEILKQCIAHTYISHVYVLTRRPLEPEFSHKKVSQLLHEDFEQYPEILLERLREEGVDGCIWSLGGKTEAFKSLDEARKVGISYPISAAEAFAKHIAAGLKPYKGYPKKLGPGVGENAFPFRFVFISGWGAEQNEFRTLWAFGDTRKIKGAAEKGIFEVADKSEEIDGHRCFEAIALRPGAVLKVGDSLGTVLTEAVSISCAVDRLANTAIRSVLNGTGGQRILENKDCLGEGWAMINEIPMS